MNIIKLKKKMKKNKNFQIQKKLFYKEIPQIYLIMIIIQFYNLQIDLIILIIIIIQIKIILIKIILIKILF